MCEGSGSIELDFFQNRTQNNEIWDAKKVTNLILLACTKLVKDNYHKMNVEATTTEKNVNQYCKNEAHSHLEFLYRIKTYSAISIA